MVTPTSLNGAYWALAVPVDSTDATKSLGMKVLMNASLMWSSPLSADRLPFRLLRGRFSPPPVRWPTLPGRPRRMPTALPSPAMKSRLCIQYPHASQPQPTLGAVVGKSHINGVSRCRVVAQGCPDPRRRGCGPVGPFIARAVHDPGLLVRRRMRSHDLAIDRPDEGRQLAGDRRGDDGRPLALPGERPKAPAQPHLRFPANLSHRPRRRRHLHLLPPPNPRSLPHPPTPPAPY